MDNPFKDAENAIKFNALLKELSEKLGSGQITLDQFEGFLRSEFEKREKNFGSRMCTLNHENKIGISVPNNFHPYAIDDLTRESFSQLSILGDIVMNESVLIPGADYYLDEYSIYENTPKEYLIAYFRGIGSVSFGMQGLLFLYEKYKWLFYKDGSHPTNFDPMKADNHCFFNDGVLLHISVHPDVVYIARQNCMAGVVRKGTRFFVFRKMSK